MKRAIATVVGVFVLAGCLQPGVTGDGPIRACGSPDDPVQSNLQGADASWLGVPFTGTRDGADLWLSTDKSDELVFGHTEVEAWALLILDPAQGGKVLVGQGGMGTYDPKAIVIGGADRQPAMALSGNASTTGQSLKLTDPVHIGPGQRVFVYVAAAQAVPQIHLVVEWSGCGATGEVVGSPEPGFAAGWPSFQSVALAAVGAAGSAAVMAHFERATHEGVVLAQAPPGDGKDLYGTATLTTNENRTTLKPALGFHVQRGGKVAYDVTYFGSGSSAAQPLLAFFPVPLTVLEGPYHPHKKDCFFNCPS